MAAGIDDFGVELANDGAAYNHGKVVGAELTRNRERATRHWRIEIQNEERHTLFEAAFVEIDRTLDRLPTWTREGIQKSTAQRWALGEILADVRGDYG